MPTQKKGPLVGAHMSIAGGLYKSIERGAVIGCTAIQIFTASNRQWHAKKPLKKDIDVFKEAWKTSPIRSVVVHASYLINIGSPKKEIADKSIKALIAEVQRCHDLGITYIILHPGARLDSPQEECLERIADNLNIVLQKTNDTKVVITLETMAGQGSNVCDTFEAIAFVMHKIKQKKRIGATFDTCHAFAAGYDISTKQGTKKVFDEFDAIIGLKHLKIIHLNDSKKDLGSRVDRHEQLGKGKIGLACFKYIMNYKPFDDIPKILETPDPALYESEIMLLKEM